MKFGAFFVCGATILSTMAAFAGDKSSTTLTTQSYVDSMYEVINTKKANKANLATVATSGSYNDLSNKPTIPTVTDTYSATSGDAMSGKAVASAISGKANTANLATVATSGSYNDLSNKPTIPAAQVNSDWNATSGVAQILNKPTLGSLATLSAVSGGMGGTITDGTIVDADIASDAKIGTGKIDFGSLAQVGTGLSAVGDGVYALTATITNGVVTLKWEKIGR